MAYVLEVYVENQESPAWTSEYSTLDKAEPIEEAAKKKGESMQIYLGLELVGEYRIRDVKIVAK